MIDGVAPSMKTERLKGLSDGVLAIVLTILVLGFEVPEHEFGEEGLIAFFGKMAEPFLAYVVSFGIVSTYWVQHAALFHYLEMGDRSLVWLNLLFLLPITMLPFLTDLRATYHDEYLATALYAGANILSGCCLFAIWTYATRRCLTRKLLPAVDRSMRRRILLGIAINVAGAAVAPIDTHLSTAVFLAMPAIYFSHRIVDSHWGGGD
jgi:uncharacterized membrane protein